MNYIVKHPVTKRRRLVSFLWQGFLEVEPFQVVLLVYAIVMFAFLVTATWMALDVTLGGDDKNNPPLTLINIFYGIPLGSTALFLFVLWYGQRSSLKLDPGTTHADAIYKGAAAYRAMPEELLPAALPLYESLWKSVRRYLIGREPLALVEAGKRGIALSDMLRAGKLVQAAKIDIYDSMDVTEARRVIKGLDQMRNKMLPSGDWYVDSSKPDDEFEEEKVYKIGPF